MRVLRRFFFNRRRILAIAAAFFLLPTNSHSVESLFTVQPTASPKLSSFGNLTVGVTTLELTNPKQININNIEEKTDRRLTVNVWYPTISAPPNAQTPVVYQDTMRSGTSFKAQGRAYRDLATAKQDEQEKKRTERGPLIILSHGYTGYRNIMFHIAEHLASHGYVVAGIDHTDSTNADIDFKANPMQGLPSTFYNRARDQQFVMEQVSTHPRFRALIDQEKSAVIGYSMGGYGALNTVGGCYKFSSQFLATMKMAEPTKVILNGCSAGRKSSDSRWKAMIAISPWGGEQEIHSPESLAEIRIPSLFISGDQDDISGYENGVKKLFSQVGAKDKYLLVYENARHNIAAHPAPSAAYSNDLDLGHYYEPSWNVESIARINQHIILAFLNCHVKNQADACEFLPERENITQVKGTDGQLSEAWPGFPNRWGTGVRFIRGQ